MPYLHFPRHPTFAGKGVKLCHAFEVQHSLIELAGGKSTAGNLLHALMAGQRSGYDMLATLHEGTQSIDWIIFRGSACSCLPIVRSRTHHLAWEASHGVRDSLINTTLQILGSVDVVSRTTYLSLKFVL